MYIHNIFLDVHVHVYDIQVHVNKMSPYSNSNYLSSTVSIV